MSSPRGLRPLSALALVALLAGCSSSPVGAPPLTVTNPSFVQVTASDTSGGEGSDGTPVVMMGDVDGDKGGVVDGGWFRVEVPEGAFDGWATIKVKQPDPTLLMCELEISPSSANQFKVPVRLIAKVPDHRAADDEMLWHDEAAGVWRRIASTSAAGNTEIVAPLSHFSSYGVIKGRAGW